MGIRLSEHKGIQLIFESAESGSETSELAIPPETGTITLPQSAKVRSEVITLWKGQKIESIESRKFDDSIYCYRFEKKKDGYVLAADYCIGVDWLGNTSKHLIVEPKINVAAAESFRRNLEDPDDHNRDADPNEKLRELDYQQMLLELAPEVYSTIEIKDLIQIDWGRDSIEIEQKDDQLTPFLVIRFLQVLRFIVQSGLKKGYYNKTENLNSRIKGKIVVGQQIRQNILRNRLTSTYCAYQEFGEDHAENRYLKKALGFVISYIENHKLFLNQNYNAIKEAIAYCQPAFERISEDVTEAELKWIKKNVLYRQYDEAIKIGKHILKRFAYNISRTTENKVKTPPFWINMPALFEVYVYSLMLRDNPNQRREILYQFSTHGNALDILVTTPGHHMIADAKYKLSYEKSLLHSDIRQVAGYARLRKVRDKLKITDDRNIDCLIIYPDIENGETDLSLANIMAKRKPIGVYHKVYKLGVRVP